ncbi:zinc-ribbon domain containing protein [Candidatus Falkowbacteria bacterium]|nr:zinc-ribbon domain containing protein [Candidatus Falkowbacteria bacterium]
MIHICANADCGKEFKIINQEKTFYAKVNLPLPIYCPDCRRTRRLQFKNPRKLYKRPCSSCQKEIITTYPLEFTSPVYCSVCFEEKFN